MLNLFLLEHLLREPLSEVNHELLLSPLDIADLALQLAIDELLIETLHSFEFDIILAKLQLARSDSHLVVNRNLTNDLVIVVQGRIRPDHQLVYLLRFLLFRFF